MREIKFRAWNGHNMELPIYDVSTQYGNKKLMQHTGLKDKNGRGIYEGDIVKGEYRTYVIEYYGAAFRLKTADDSSPDLLPVLENSSRIEVIGNIYENPELVEANQ